jgi:hypothetical protein
MFGLVPLSKIATFGEAATEAENVVSRNITNLLSQDLATSFGEWGFDLRFVPSEGFLALMTPKVSGEEFKQYIFGVANRGWTTYEGIPWIHCEVHGGSMFMGTDDGRVIKYTGYLDDNTDSVEWHLITRFNDYGEPALNKRGQFCRPIFITQATPSWFAEARYDFDMSRVSATPTPPSVATPGSWDSAIWDTDVWTGQNIISQRLQGTTGIGRYVAIALRGSSYVPTTLAGIDIMMDAGGML